MLPCFRRFRRTHFSRIPGPRDPFRRHAPYWVAALVSVTTLTAAAPATAGASVTSGPTDVPPADVVRADCTDDWPSGGRLDGFAIDAVPMGVGALVTDFSYEWEGVTFASRVWESGPHDDGSYNVDASVKILRGARLTDLPALIDYLATYYDKDPDAWDLAPFVHPEGPGRRGSGEALWLVEPGVAVSVRIDGNRFTAADLIRMAHGVTQLPD